jgi:hypothetical protein
MTDLSQVTGKYGQQRSYYLEKKNIYKTQQKSLMLVNNALIVVTQLTLSSVGLATRTFGQCMVGRHSTIC